MTIVQLPWYIEQNVLIVIIINTTIENINNNSYGSKQEKVNNQCWVFGKLHVPNQCVNVNCCWSVTPMYPLQHLQTASLSLLEWSAQLCVNFAAPLRLPVCPCWNGQPNSVFTSSTSQTASLSLLEWSV